MLDGAKSVVLHGDCADKLIVTARIAGGARDRDGIGLFLVDANAPGVSRRGYPTQDGLRAAEITLAGVRVGPEAVLGEPGAALPLIERVVDEAIAALCAEAVGAMAVDARADRRLPEDAPAVRPRRSARSRCCSTARSTCWSRSEQARSMAMFATMMASEAERRRAPRAIVGGKGADRPLRASLSASRRSSCMAASA